MDKNTKESRRLFVDSTTCCGMKQMANVQYASTPMDIINTWTKYYLNGGRTAFIVFSLPVKNKLGSEFQLYVKENKLGTVTVCPVFKIGRAEWNIYIWETNVARLEGFIQEEATVYPKVGKTAVRNTVFTWNELGLKVGDKVTITSVSSGKSLMCVQDSKGRILNALSMNLFDVLI